MLIDRGQQAVGVPEIGVQPNGFLQVDASGFPLGMLEGDPGGDAEEAETV